MAGDEPSEDAEAGADGDEAADGDPGGDSASDEPTAGDAPEDTPTGEPTEDPTDDSRVPVDDQGSAEVETAEAADDTDADESKGTTGDETVTDDEAVEAEAEALVEKMEAAVEEAEPVEASDAEGDHAGSESGDDEAPADEPAAEPHDDESLPMAPDHEVDPDVDPPVPSEPEEADVGADAEVDVADSPVDVAESPGHASPMVDDVDEPDELDDSDVSEGVFGGARSGPAEDREMPLADHIREMLRRLAVVVAVAGFVSLLVFPFAEEIINFLWYSILPGVESDIARPRLYGVLELVFTELKVASLAGLIVALPVMVYETYAFMRPGLYPHERRYYLAAIPTSLVLAIVGVAFAYFVVLPSIFVYFLYYSQDVATIGFALGRTFDLILLMMAYLAVVFQIPLFIMLAMMMGLVTRRWLADRRLLFWGAFLGISFLFSFDPTGMAPIIVAATMIVLFEGTLLLTKWTGRE